MSTTETSASGTKTGMDGNRKIMLGLVAALVVVVVGMVFWKTAAVSAVETKMAELQAQQAQAREQLITQLESLLPAAEAPASTDVPETLVKDGQTLVLGGIYVIETAENESRVPYLWKLPILGRAFAWSLPRCRSNRWTRSRRSPET